MSALGDFLADQVPEPRTEEENTGWSIGTLGEAGWAMRKLAALRHAQDEARQVAADEKAQIDVWLAAELARHERSAEFFEHHLTVWWGAQLEERLAETGAHIGGPGWEEAWDRLRTKSQTLPGGGAVKARKSAAAWAIGDEFTCWALDARPELVETKHTPRRADVKAVFDGRVTPDGDVVDDTGEKVPGIAVTPPTVTITVEVPK